MSSIDDKNDPQGSRDPAKGPGQGNDTAWQSAALMHVATASIDEQRRSRRWRIFLTLVFLLFLWTAFTSSPSLESTASTMSFSQNFSNQGDFDRKSTDHVALIKLWGVIVDAPGAEDTINTDRVMRGLEAAAESDKCVGVILSVNSPGGGVFESAKLHDAILKFREENPTIPIVALAQDIAFSGGVYISMAVEKFFAHETSMVGSIGVIIPSFGAEKAIEKLGIERRIIASGPNKAIFDPFSPFSADHRQRLQEIIDEMYRLFVARVTESRGDRLNAPPGELFSGAFWHAAKAMEYGLIDGIGDIDAIAQQEFGTTDISDYTIRQNPFEKFLHGVQSALGLADVLSGSPVAGSTEAASMVKPYYLAF